MTDLEKAAKQALEDVCAAKICEFNSMSSRHEMIRLLDKAITALRQALEKTNQQEPVAWMHTNATGHVYFRKNPQDKTFNPVPLYTHPHGVTGESK